MALVVSLDMLPVGINLVQVEFRKLRYLILLTIPGASIAGVLLYVGFEVIFPPVSEHIISIVAFVVLSWIGVKALVEGVSDREIWKLHFPIFAEVFLTSLAVSFMTSNAWGGIMVGVFHCLIIIASRYLAIHLKEVAGRFSSKKELIAMLISKAAALGLVIYCVVKILLELHEILF